MVSMPCINWQQKSWAQVSIRSALDTQSSVISFALGEKKTNYNWKITTDPSIGLQSFFNGYQGLHVWVMVLDSFISLFLMVNLQGSPKVANENLVRVTEECTVQQLRVKRLPQV